MKKYVLLAVLLLALVVTAVSCDSKDDPADTTDAVETTVENTAEETTEATTEESTEATTEETTEEASAEETTEEASAEETTEEASVEETTEEATTEEATTEEATTEEVTTAEPETEPSAPRYDDYNVPMDGWTVSGHCPQIVGSEGHANSPMVAAGGIAQGALLHQGSIGLGEIDLSKYSKVIIKFGVDNSDVTWGHYDASANNRIMLVNADVNMVMSPAAEQVIAGETYEPCGWSLVEIEIDLTNVDYNGPVFVTYDTLPGTFMLFGSVEFIGAEMPAPAEPVELDLSTLTSTGNYPTVDVPVPGSVFGTDHCFALHYGSINLGEIDLSRYSKVIVTYATPDDATVPGASDQYNMTGKRVLLLNAPSASQETFEYLPEESAIITSTQYEMSPASLTTTTVEIDLTNVTYNGTVYLTFDYRDADNGQAATGFLVWVTGISLA
ncbi:MAG: hypothetical protein IKU90_02305 [Clostridia bacterium]|nr:hypothetical protein [Clostridia bacterium]